MAARGTLAKDNVITKIKNTFGDDFIGEYDKKIYVWANDGGERVQIALALTCPKNLVGLVNESTMNYNTGRDFSNDNTIVTPPSDVEITEEEKENVRKLMASMGL